MSSVLYDVPGPRAIARNRIIGVATVLAVVAVVGFLLWRMIATGQLTASKWEIFTFPNVWMQVGLRTWNTVSAFLVAALGALALGFLLAIGRLSEHAWVRAPFTAIIEIMRAIPVLVFMMILYYALPALGLRVPTFWAVVIALICYNGSVLAEVIRAGVESLPRGQKEAGYAIGLRKSGVMRLILLPQAIRAMLPAIIAQLVVTLKDTALGFIITYPELLDYAKFIGSQTMYDSPVIPAMMVAGAIYIVLCLILSYVANVVEKRIRRDPKLPKNVRKRETTNTQIIAAQDVETEVGSGGTGSDRRAP